MPWKSSDAEGHSKKADTPKKQRAWATVANTRLAACRKAGGSQDACEASAIKVANAMVSNMGEEDVQEAATKTVDGKPYPAGDFLVVTDPDQSSTWHLQVKRNGTPIPRLMGAAWAALHGGYRGNKYEGPDKTEAISKLKALYKAQDMETPSESADMSTNTLKEILEAMQVLTADITALKEQITDLKETVLTANQAPLIECQLAESDVGAVIALHESQVIEKDAPEPLQLDVVVIEPGWGNKKNNHYYSEDMLKEYAHVFNGAKMYATDHKSDDKSVLTEVSQVLDCPVSFTETGAPVARVGIFNDEFAAGIRNREALGTLDSLHVSILATGTAREYEENGRKGKYVESIAAGANVDWVTRAGAGGRALRLAAKLTETDNGGAVVADKEKEPKQEQLTEEPTKEQPIKETGTEDKVTEKPQPVLLSEADVKAALDASKLPDISREKLGSGEYEDKDAIKAAITAEVEYVTALTGAGKPVGQQIPAQKQEQPKADALNETYVEIEKRYGVSLPYQKQGE